MTKTAFRACGYQTQGGGSRRVSFYTAMYKEPFVFNSFPLLGVAFKQVPNRPQLRQINNVPHKQIAGYTTGRSNRAGRASYCLVLFQLRCKGNGHKVNMALYTEYQHPHYRVKSIGRSRCFSAMCLQRRPWCIERIPEDESGTNMYRRFAHECGMTGSYNIAYRVLWVYRMFMIIKNFGVLNRKNSLKMYCLQNYLHKMHFAKCYHLSALSKKILNLSARNKIKNPK
jgi:hypothetical protein